MAQHIHRIARGSAAAVVGLALAGCMFTIGAGTASAETAHVGTVSTTSGFAPLALDSSTEFVPKEPFTLRGRASPGAAVTVKIPGALIYSGTWADSDGRWSFPLTLPSDGGYGLQLSQSSDAGSESLDLIQLTSKKPGSSGLPAQPVLGVSTTTFDPYDYYSEITGTATRTASVRVTIAGKDYFTAADDDGNWHLPNVTGLVAPSYRGTAVEVSGGAEKRLAFTVESTRAASAPAAPIVTATSFDPRAESISIGGTALPGAYIDLSVNGTRYSAPADSTGSWTVRGIATPPGVTAAVSASQVAHGLVSAPADSFLSAVADDLGAHDPSPTPHLAFTNPTDPSAGYVAQTGFIFRGTAVPGARIVLTNYKGTVLASGIVAGDDGAWSWTRANLGTSIWKITATSDGGTPREEQVTLPDFAPRS